MIIMAIDPGPQESGYIVWDSAFQEIRAKGIEDNYILRCETIQMYRDRCDILAVEMIACYGMPVGREVFETLVWIGRFMEVFGGQDDRIRLIPKREIQMFLCNSTKAKKSNIRRALIDRLGKPGTKKQPGITYGILTHLWDALAVAIVVSEDRYASQDALSCVKNESR